MTMANRDSSKVNSTSNDRGNSNIQHSQSKDSFDLGGKTQEKNLTPPIGAPTSPTPANAVANEDKAAIPNRREENQKWGKNQDKAKNRRSLADSLRNAKNAPEAASSQPQTRTEATTTPLDPRVSDETRDVVDSSSFIQEEDFTQVQAPRYVPLQTSNDVPAVLDTETGEYMDNTGVGSTPQQEEVVDAVAPVEAPNTQQQTEETNGIPNYFDMSEAQEVATAPGSQVVDETIFSPDEISQLNNDKDYSNLRDRDRAAAEADQSYVEQTEEEEKRWEPFRGFDSENGRFRTYQSMEAYDKERTELMEENGVGYMANQQKKQRDTVTRDASVNRIHRDLTEGVFEVPGMTFDEKTGKPVFTDKDVESALTNVLRTFNWGMDDIAIAQSAIQMVSGISIDRSGKMFGESAEHAGAYDRDSFIRACNNLVIGASDYGNPFHFFDTSWKFAGSIRYPAGIPFAYMASKMMQPGSTMNKWYNSSKEFAEACLADWFTNTLPEISSHAKEDQKIVLTDMIRAIADMDNVDPIAYGISGDDDMSLSNMRDIGMYSAVVKDKDSKKIEEMTTRRRKKAEDDVRRQYYKIKPGNENKPDTWKPRAQHNFITGLRSLRRLLGALNPVLFITNAGEHANNNIGGWIFTHIANPGRNNHAHDLSDWARDQLKSDENLGSLNAIGTLVRAGGRAMLDDYTLNFKKPMTMENVQEYINQFVKKPDSKFYKAANKAEQLVSQIMSGDFLFKRSDMNFFCAYVDLHQAVMADKYNERNALTQMGEQTEDQEGALDYEVFTTEQMDSAIRERGSSQFMVDLVSTEAGWRAYLQIQNHTLNGLDPITNKISAWERNHPIASTFYAFTVDPFLRYGVKVFEAMFPLTHTANYVAVKTIAKGSQDFSVFGYEDFWSGLKHSIQYDICTSGTRIAAVMIMYGVIKALGHLQPPEDPNKLFNLEEWIVGGSQRTFNWALDDIVLWSAPLAGALDIYETTGDAMFAANILSSSILNTLDGCAIMDTYKVMKDFVSEIFYEPSEYDGDLNDALENPAESPFSLSNLMMAGRQMMLKQAGYMIVPPALNSFLKDNFWSPETVKDRSAYRKFKADGSGETEQVTDYGEQRDRRTGKNNEGAGILLDIFTQGVDIPFLGHIGGIGVPGETQTGYRFSEMPVDERTDPLQYYNFLNLNIDLENIPEGMSGDDYIQQQVDKSIAEIEKYIGRNDGTALFTDKEAIENFVLEGGDAAFSLGDASGPLYAAKNGLVLPYETRKWLDQYCSAWSNYAYNTYNLAKAQGAFNYKNLGISYEEASKRANDAYQRAKQVADYWKNLKDQWVWSDDIPYSATKYVAHRTSYNNFYTWKDSGEPASYADALNPLNWGKIKENTYRYGDRKSDWNPIVEPEGPTNTYDRQTPVSWFDDRYTDPEFIKENIGDATITWGNREGDSLSDAVFGQGDTYVPSIGSRGYEIPETIYMDRDSVAYNDANLWTGKLGELGKYMTDEEIAAAASKGQPVTTGYTTSWYKGGSGSGYNPRIYSNQGKSINAPKATTMYASKNRSYGSTTSYLRPEFTTKGSREAYRRSDY